LIDHGKEKLDPKENKELFLLSAQSCGSIPVPIKYNFLKYKVKKLSSCKNEARLATKNINKGFFLILIIQR
jgi:hypothetical protein